MKRLLLVAIAVIIVSGLIMVGCSETPSTPTPTPAPAPAPSPAPSPAPAPAPAKTIELKFAHSFPPQSDLGVGLDNWAKKIESDSAGQVKITVYPASSLIQAREFYDATASGVTDIAYGNLNHVLEHFALETALGLPGLPWPQEYPDVSVRMDVLNQLRQKFPEVEENRKEVVDLYDVTNPPYVFHAPNHVVQTPDDIKGLQIAASGSFVSMAEVLGAIPVNIPSPDRYIALERGTVDGSWDVWGGIRALKLLEVSDNYYQGAGFGNGLNIVIMGVNKWNTLPANIQEIFINNRQYGLEQANMGMYAEEDVVRQEVIDRGSTIRNATPEQQDLWRQALSPMFDVWVEENEARGLPAREFLDEMLKLIEQAS
jgi:TRAP-type C4-dicarboxylate transport system substrate-binding protein